MSEIDEHEISEIIERVRRRVAAAGDERPGAGLRADAELAAADDRRARRRRSTPRSTTPSRRPAQAFRGVRGPGPGRPQGDHRRRPAIHARQRRAARPDGPPGDAPRARRGQDRQEPPRGLARRPARRTSRSRPSAATPGMMVTEFAPFGVVARDHAGHEPDLDDHQQHDQHRLGRATRSSSTRIRTRGAARRRRSASSTARSSAPAGRRTWSAAVVAPTIETARALMSHPGVRVLLVTGGPGRRARGAPDGQAGDHRRPGQPAGRRRRRPPTSSGRPATSSAAPRSTTTSCASTRRSCSSWTRSPTGSSGR